MRNLFKLLALLVLCIPLNAQLLDGTRVYSDTSDGAEFCIEELYTNGSSGVCLKAPDSLASELVFTLPSAYPGGTYCLQMSATGVISTTGAACGGAGTSYYQTMRDAGVDETQRSNLNFVSASMVLTDDSGNNETEFALTSSPSNAATLVGTGRSISTTSPITGGGDLSANRTIACATCVTTNTTQTISAAKTFTANILAGGSGTPHIGSVSDWFGDLWVQDGRANRWRVGAYSGFGVFTDYHRWEIGAGLHLSQIENGSGVAILSFDSTGTPQVVTIGGNLEVDDNILPDSPGTGSVGVLGDEFDEMWVDDQYCIDNAGITGTTCLNSVSVGGTEVLQLSAAAVSSSGSFYQRTFSGSDVSCSGVADGWFGVRTDTEELQFCEGSATKVVPSVGNSFSPVTVNCASGEVITDPRYENGILVEGSCGAN